MLLEKYDMRRQPLQGARAHKPGKQAGERAVASLRVGFRPVRRLTGMVRPPIHSISQTAKRSQPCSLRWTFRACCKAKRGEPQRGARSRGKRAIVPAASFRFSRASLSNPNKDSRGFDCDYGVSCTARVHAWPRPAALRTTVAVNVCRIVPPGISPPRSVPAEPCPSAGCQALQHQQRQQSITSKRTGAASGSLPAPRSLCTCSRAVRMRSATCPRKAQHCASRCTKAVHTHLAVHILQQLRPKRSILPRKLLPTRRTSPSSTTPSRATAALTSNSGWSFARTARLTIFWARCCARAAVRASIHARPHAAMQLTHPVGAIQPQRL